MVLKKGEFFGIYKNFENVGILKFVIKFVKDLEKKNVVEVIVILKFYFVIVCVMGY